MNKLTKAKRKTRLNDNEVKEVERMQMEIDAMYYMLFHLAAFARCDGYGYALVASSDDDVNYCVRTLYNFIKEHKETPKKRGKMLLKITTDATCVPKKTALKLVCNGFDVVYKKDKDRHKRYFVNIDNIEQIINIRNILKCGIEIIDTVSEGKNILNIRRTDLY